MAKAPEDHKMKTIIFVRQNIVIWILLCLTALSVYSHYKTGKKLTRVCRIITELTCDFSDIEIMIRQAKRHKKIIEGTYEISSITDEHEKLIKIDSSEGFEYRYRYSLWKELRQICQNRL